MPAPRLTGSASTCTTRLGAGAAVVTNCTYTFTYATAGPSHDGAAIATARIHGRTRVVAHGRLRRRRLTLVFKHLHRGRYRLTLLELRRHQRPVVLGTSTIVFT
jgi:hypothetical protein